MSEETSEPVLDKLAELAHADVAGLSEYLDTVAVPLLSKETRHERQVMLKVSLLAYVVTWGGVAPSGCSFLGVDFGSVNLPVLYLMLGMVLVYLLRSFFVRGTREFLASWTQRQLSGCDAAVASLNRWAAQAEDFARRMKSDPPATKKEAVAASDKQRAAFEEASDIKPFRSPQIHGTNKTAFFWEILLPLLVVGGAIASCVFFAIKEWV